MQIFFWIVGGIIVFLVLHRILMKWQISRSVDYLLDNAKPMADDPKLMERDNLLKKRIDELKDKKFDSQDDLLYDLSILHILFMNNEEAGWSFSRQDYYIKRIDPTHVHTRLTINHFSGKARTYQFNYLIKGSNLQDVGSYKTESEMLDIFGGKPDEFYSFK